jgi:C4-dicarboxylate-specific signal transduction histidine kinase
LPSPSPQLGDILKRAEKQAHRAGQIIKHLREFVGKDDSHKEPVDLDLLIAGMIEFLRPELVSEQVTVEHHQGAGGNKVMANKIQIEQVLVNLVLNSQEAIRSSENTTGNIVVETHLLPNSALETRVIDNGPVINADIAGKVFDPFQTSKPTGMGMGLSISRSIIEEHGGRLWTDAQHCDGALFAFTLPIANEA